MKKVCILCYLIFTTVAFSQIPQTVSYQGVLTDAQGNAVADGSYSLTFNLYELSKLQNSGQNLHHPTKTWGSYLSHSSPKSQNCGSNLPSPLKLDFGGQI